LITCSWVLFITSGLQSIQTDIRLLIIIRSIAGLAVGSSSAISPIYISELSSAKRRGMIVSLYQLYITISIVMAYALNHFFYRVSNGWRIEFAITSLPAIIFLICSIKLPDTSNQNLKNESDNNQIRNGGYIQLNSISEEGSISLIDDNKARFTQSQTVQQSKDKIVYVQDINNNSTSQKPKQKLNQLKNLKIAFNNHPRQFLIGIILALTQQITGINAIIMFSPNILQASGIQDTKMQLLTTIGIGAWNMVTTVIAVFLVDIIGRRPLLITGFSLMGLGHGLVLISLIIRNFQFIGNLSLYFAIPGLLVFLLGFEVGPGPIYFVLVSELFPANVRGVATSLMTAINWAGNILVVLTFLPLVEIISAEYVYLTFMVLSIGSAVFVYYMVKETKGKNLDEIHPPQ
ncbi:MAG: sugar porter family MFS transporter, partial [Streblomastix strix]